MAVVAKRSRAPERVSFAKTPEIIAIPNLIEIQRRSFDQFLQLQTPPHQREEIGLQGVFASIFPITDYDDSASLEFVKYEFGEPKYTAEECREKGMTFSVPLKVTLRLVVWDKGGDGAKSIRDIKEQEVYLGEMPLMTEHGTFIINGTERVAVSQLHRSPGVFFDSDGGKTHVSGKTLYSSRLIPYRGSWLEFEFDGSDVLHVRIDRRRKFLVTILLRALGIGNNEEILRLFYERDALATGKGGREFLLQPADQEVPGTFSYRVTRDQPEGAKEPVVQAGRRLARATLKRLRALKIKQVPVHREDVLGRFLATDLVAPKTGEVVAESGQEVTADLLEKLAGHGLTQFPVLSGQDNREVFSIRETLLKDATRSEEEALVEIYRRMRPGDPPTLESCRALLENMFFSPRRYDLSKVGRLKMNQKLGMEVPLDVRILRQEDIVAIIRYLLKLKAGEGSIDDIDHLGNRRVRSAGELLEEQFRIGLARMERAVRERMSTQELETLMPHDLVNAKPVTAALKEFFGSSQLSQFMDQTNPLAELTHKRRLSALGPGGLSRERAGFEVRDVHPTHYGRMCPIETPEGPNVGLIASLSTYARVNDFGFVETPYRKVRDGRVTDEIEYLTADVEEKYTIAQANAEVDGRGRLQGDRVSARRGGNFVLVPPADVQYMDVSPKQLVGVSTSLIPFLEHDDANRALMGANMQRQAVPLLRPEAPVVGTGMEHVAAKDSGAVVVARRAGTVESVSADRIMVRTNGGGDGGAGVDIYNLLKFKRSNQNTCINQKPIVRKGEQVEKGQVIADGPATQSGELALGQNVLVAFMPWGGYNFEDAILISEKLVKDDRYTSIHIEEFEIEARDTKLGKEEITRDIPNVGEEALKDLDESGIIRIGAEVKPGDILVGKVTPKGETVLTPEERLLRAIFGEKAEDVRDASLYVPPGIAGTVVDVKVFSRKGVEKDERAKSIEDEEIARLKRDFDDESTIIQAERDKRLQALLEGRTPGKEVRSRTTRKIIAPKRKKLTAEVLDKLGHEDLVHLAGQLDAESAAKAARITDAADAQMHILETLLEERIARVKRGDELAPGVFKMVKVYVAMKRKLSVGDKIAGRHGNKGVIAKILPEEDMPYLPDGTPVEVVLNPLGVPSRMNVGQILETHLGWAAQALGLRVSSPVFDGATEKEIKGWLKKAKHPSGGKTALYDGRTGRPFHQAVTVGYIYLMKLAHLVDDKIHARSIGPYSLVTQQPLGGKAQFGGQRFGEMEVWALEAYGAAYTLQEMLTVKSDDVVGRTKMYESIVKGDCDLQPGLPESFNVLVKELQSLCLDVELLRE